MVNSTAGILTRMVKVWLQLKVINIRMALRQLRKVKPGALFYWDIGCFLAISAALLFGPPWWGILAAALCVGIWYLGSRYFTRRWRELPSTDLASDLEDDIDYEKAARFLFDRLDDIDTLDDACKGDDHAFREQVRRVQRRRFEVASTDGFSVTFRQENYVGDEEKSR